MMKNVIGIIICIVILAGCTERGPEPQLILDWRLDQANYAKDVVLGITNITDNYIMGVKTLNESFGSGWSTIRVEYIDDGLMNMTVEVNVREKEWSVVE